MKIIASSFFRAFALVLLLMLLHCGGKEKIVLKQDYTLQEILARVSENYGSLKTVQMSFADTVKMVYTKTNIDVLEIRKGKLCHVLNGPLKATAGDIELVVDKNMGIIGKYEGIRQLLDFNHLAQWIGVVYKMVLLLPMQFQEIAKYKEVTVEKTKLEGDYILMFPEGKDGIAVRALVNMAKGSVEKISIRQSSLFRDMEKGLTYAPYEINARLDEFKKYDQVLFPGKIKVQYKGKEGVFLFDSRVDDVEVNRKIKGKNLVLSPSGRKSISYRDPLWLDRSTLVLLRMAGDRIKNEYDELEIVNKNFSIVKKDIETGKEEILKEIMFSPDKAFTTRFIFTGNYNRKYNKLAYAITEKVWNENQEINKFTGVYIMDLARKQDVVKVSDKGFMPLWSGNGEELIWCQAEENKKDNEINDVWLCNKDGQGKKMIIPNGFHCSWAVEDQFLVVERGFWAFSRGYIIGKDKNVEQGLYLYDIKNNNLRLLIRPGFNPHVSSSRKKVLFSDTVDRSGIYLWNLENDMKTTLVKLKKSYDIIDPYWGPEDQSVLYIFASCDTDKSMKCGLHKYSFTDNSDKLMTEEIKYMGSYTYFLDYSRDGRYLLYKLYQEPDWYSYNWGVYNTIEEKSMLKY